MDRYSEMNDNVFCFACHLRQWYVNPDKEFHYVSMFLISEIFPMTSFLIESVCQFYSKGLCGFFI